MTDQPLSREAQRVVDNLHLANRWDARADDLIERGMGDQANVTQWLRLRALAAKARGKTFETVDALAELIERGHIKP